MFQHTSPIWTPRKNWLIRRCRLSLPSESYPPATLSKLIFISRLRLTEITSLYSLYLSVHVRISLGCVKSQPRKHDQCVTYDWVFTRYPTWHSFLIDLTNNQKKKSNEIQLFFSLFSLCVFSCFDLICVVVVILLQICLFSFWSYFDFHVIFKF